MQTHTTNPYLDAWEEWPHRHYRSGLQGHSGAVAGPDSEPEERPEVAVGLLEGPQTLVGQPKHASQ